MSGKYSDAFVEHMVQSYKGGCSDIAPSCYVGCSCAEGWTAGSARQNSDGSWTTSFANENNGDNIWAIDRRHNGGAYNSTQLACYKAGCESGYYVERPSSSIFIEKQSSTEKHGLPCFKAVGCKAGFTTEKIDGAESYTYHGFTCYKNECDDGYFPISEAPKDYQKYANIKNSVNGKCYKPTCFSTASSSSLGKAISAGAIADTGKTYTVTPKGTPEDKSISCPIYECSGKYKENVYYPAYTEYGINTSNFKTIADAGCSPEYTAAKLNCYREPDGFNILTPFFKNNGDGTITIQYNLRSTFNPNDYAKGYTTSDLGEHGYTYLMKSASSMTDETLHSLKYHPVEVSEKGYNLAPNYSVNTTYFNVASNIYSLNYNNGVGGVHCGYNGFGTSILNIIENTPPKGGESLNDTPKNSIHVIAVTYDMSNEYSGPAPSWCDKIGKRCVANRVKLAGQCSGIPADQEVEVRIKYTNGGTPPANSSDIPSDIYVYRLTCADLYSGTTDYEGEENRLNMESIVFDSKNSSEKGITGFSIASIGLVGEDGNAVSVSGNGNIQQKLLGNNEYAFEPNKVTIGVTKDYRGHTTTIFTAGTFEPMVKSFNKSPYKIIKQ